MFSPELLDRAEALLAAARARGLKIATAESCTGGLIAALLTEIPGSSDVFERGFVTYSNQAKTELLDVPPELLEEHGAVSWEVAFAMAKGALLRSQAQIAVAVTGIAGPGGGTAEKPVGMVHVFVAHSRIFPCGFGKIEQFGDIGRDQVRLKTVGAALELLQSMVLDYLL